MITAEQHARIRQLFFAEHWKVGTIATELGLHPDAVKRALETERFGRRMREQRPSMLDPFKPFILEVLDKHPRLRASRIHQMVRARGYRGGVVTVRRYVRRIRPPAASEAFLRLETMPAEQAQVDWGSFGKLKVGHAERRLSCFVMVLGYSRALYARFTLDESLASFVRCHVLGFERFGGVPRTILYDNLKSVVLERVGEHVRFHPRILELAGHYHFAPKPVAPYRGNEKGKVERTIQYLRHSFFAARTFRDTDELNAQLETWADEVAHTRTHPTDPERRTVREMLENERGLLLPMPEHPFEHDLVLPVASGKRPYVRFDKNDYSIPHELARRPLTLVASEHQVRVVEGTVVVATHRRSYDRRQVIEDPAHLKALAEKKRAAKELRGRDRLRVVCPSADRFFEALAQRSKSLSHHSRRLTQLLEQYDAETLESAIAEALERGAVGAPAVAHLCDQRTRERGLPPTLIAPLPDDPRVRDTEVLAHDLATYDVLTEEEDGADE